MRHKYRPAPKQRAFVRTHTNHPFEETQKASLIPVASQGAKQKRATPLNGPPFSGETIRRSTQGYCSHSFSVKNRGVACVEAAIDVKLIETRSTRERESSLFPVAYLAGAARLQGLCNRRRPLFPKPKSKCRDHAIGCSPICFSAQEIDEFGLQRVNTGGRTLWRKTGAWQPSSRRAQHFI